MEETVPGCLNFHKNWWPYLKANKLEYDHHLGKLFLYRSLLNLLDYVDLLFLIYHFMVDFGLRQPTPLRGQSSYCLRLFVTAVLSIQMELNYFPSIKFWKKQKPCNHYNTGEQLESKIKVFSHLPFYKFGIIIIWTQGCSCAITLHGCLHVHGFYMG